MESRYSPSSFHITQILGSAAFSKSLVLDEVDTSNQDRILAEAIAVEAQSIRAQRSQYLPEPLPFPLVVIAG